jgi:hypothetical protein
MPGFCFIFGILSIQAGRRFRPQTTTQALELNNKLEYPNKESFGGAPC